MQFVLASSNAHKAEEIQLLLSTQTLVLQSAIGVEPAIESGNTFVENALIKAQHASRISGLPAIADDSGICVDALGGAPGIFSARYSGAEATDEQNVAKLLDDMQGQTDRSAFFYCVLVCIQSADDPCPLIAEGAWSGEITSTPCGSAGFGYDPVFYLPTLKKTAAELSREEKTGISHRGQALRSLVSRLNARYPA